MGGTGCPFGAHPHGTDTGDSADGSGWEMARRVMGRTAPLLLVLALILQACSLGTDSGTQTPAAAHLATTDPYPPTKTLVERRPDPSATAVPATASPAPTVRGEAPIDGPVPTAGTEPTAAARPTERVQATRSPATSTPAPTATPEPTPARPVARYVRTRGYAGANLRERPALDSPVLIAIPYGARVGARAIAADGTDESVWHEVTYRGRTGYVHGTLLSSDRPPARPTPTASPRPPAGTWTLTAVGDIMLSRNVLGRMEAYGSYRHPFVQTDHLLRAADITVANLEGQVSDHVTRSSDPHTFSFVSPAAVLDGVRWAGIDAVSLANNHTLDYGTGALADTMRALEGYGIGHFGAGRDRESSYEPRIFAINGQRVALLGFTDLSNTAYPAPSLPTPAPAHSAERVAEAVRVAEERADVVIAYFHWGVEYVAVPNQRQRSLAHAAVDAGADLVLGAHPHWVQTAERYQGTPIHYSLGNFVFDQMWSRETRRGVVATFTFRGARVVDTGHTPVLIWDYNQPRIATGYDSAAVLERLRLRE